MDLKYVNGGYTNPKSLVSKTRFRGVRAVEKTVVNRLRSDSVKAHDFAFIFDRSEANRCYTHMYARKKIIINNG